MLESLADRRMLSRRAAVAFILVNYYRRAILAAIILYSYNNPLAQVICCMFLQLGYVVFLANFRVYRDVQE